MDIQTLLIGEIQRQCNFALIAFEDIKKSLEKIATWDNQESDRFWYSVQSFLVAAANISKIVWPVSSCSSGVTGPVESQRKAIQQLLELDDTSPLKSRKFRNYFEHYDYELEKWFRNSNDRMILDNNIIDFDPAGVPSEKLLSIRNFNLIKFKLYFRNSEYDFTSTINAITSLLMKIQK